MNPPDVLPDKAACNPTRWMLTAILAALLTMAACSRRSSVDTVAFEKNFKSASPVVQARVNTAVAAIKSADYRTAKNVLHVLRDDTSLTPEQQQAIWDLMGKIQ